MAETTCGCPPEAFDEDSEHPPCPHWCIEDVPTNQLRDGDVFAIRGDLPLELSWHVVVGNADPITGSYGHRPFWQPQVRRGPSTPINPTQPTRVLRFGALGRQTLDPEAPDA